MTMSYRLQRVATSSSRCTSLHQMLYERIADPVGHYVDYCIGIDCDEKTSLTAADRGQIYRTNPSGLVV